MHGVAARALIIVASLWTAGLQLFSPSSLAYRAAGDSWLIDAVHWAVLGITGLAAVDLLWKDVFRRGLVWPSFPAHARHHVCVATYSALAGAFAVRAFIAAGDSAAVLQVGIYYVLIAAGIAVEAAAIASEERQACHTDSSNG